MKWTFHFMEVDLIMLFSSPLLRHLRIFVFEIISLCEGFRERGGRQFGFFFFLFYIHLFSVFLASKSKIQNPIFFVKRVNIINISTCRQNTNAQMNERTGERRCVMRRI